MNEGLSPTSGKSEDRPALEVACLDRSAMRAALVATLGNHCRVWRGALKDETTSTKDSGYAEYVIKYPVELYDDNDARILRSQYGTLRDALGEIIPEALFVKSRIDGRTNLFVIARAVDIWFNIANPTNREEAIGLLREHPIARHQLSRFVAQAKRWRQPPNPRLIDLYGLDNLIMDKQRQIRYVDSFFVFFFEDMLHLIGGEPDYELEDKIRVSQRRLAYLDDVVRAASV